MGIDGISKKRTVKRTIEDNSAFLLPEEALLESSPIEPEVTSVVTEEIENGKKRNPSTKKSQFTKIIVAGILLFVITVTIGRAYGAKRELTILSNEAQKKLQTSVEYIEQGDLPAAMTEADKASDDLLKIKLIAQSWGQDIKYLRLTTINSKLVENERLLNATYRIVDTLNSINSAISSLGDGETSGGQGKDFIYNISKSRSILLSIINESVEKLETSKKELTTANQLNNEQNVSIVSMIDNTIKNLTAMKNIVDQDLPWLSGEDGEEKNILVIFQNNAELRGGSGGSLGSFGVAKFKKGKLVSTDFAKNIYKIDREFELSGEFVPVPEELKWLRGNLTWTLKDAGWAVDGAESMEKIIWFYEKETKQSVDGALMIDTTAAIDILSAIGPISLPQYQKTLTSENFRSEVEFEVHKAYFDREGGKTENEPKKILSEMMPIFLDRIFSGLGKKDESARLLSTLSKSLKEKDIILYFKNESFQKRLTEKNLSGSIYPATGDYLYINNSNIDGGKSSHLVDEEINLSVLINSNGDTSNELNVKRTHSGDGNWPDGKNKNFIRLLLPEKSEIIQFKPKSGNYQKFYNQGLTPNDYYLSTDKGKRVVNFWMNTDPKSQSELSIKYNTNYKLATQEESFNYVLDFQKQPGSMADRVDLTIVFPYGFKPTNVSNFEPNQNKINLKFDLKSDRKIKINFIKLK